MAFKVNRVVTDVNVAETHINAFKQEALDTVAEAYKVIEKLEAKVNALIAKYEA